MQLGYEFYSLSYGGRVVAQYTGKTNLPVPVLCCTVPGAGKLLFCDTCNCALSAPAVLLLLLLYWTRLGAASSSVVTKHVTHSYVYIAVTLSQ